jgi:hypothetical protein
LRIWGRVISEKASSFVNALLVYSGYISLLLARNITRPEISKDVKYFKKLKETLLGPSIHLGDGQNHHVGMLLGLNDTLAKYTSEDVPASVPADIREHLRESCQCREVLATERLHDAAKRSNIGDKRNWQVRCIVCAFSGVRLGLRLDVAHDDFRAKQCDHASLGLL